MSETGQNPERSAGDLSFFPQGGALAWWLLAFRRRFAFIRYLARGSNHAGFGAFGHRLTRVSNSFAKRLGCRYGMAFFEVVSGGLRAIAERASTNEVQFPEP